MYRKEIVALNLGWWMMLMTNYASRPKIFTDLKQMPRTWFRKNWDTELKLCIKTNGTRTPYGMVYAAALCRRLPQKEAYNNLHYWSQHIQLDQPGERHSSLLHQRAQASHIPATYRSTLTKVNQCWGSGSAVQLKLKVMKKVCKIS
jgi:hypothetical protein